MAARDITGLQEKSEIIKAIENASNKNLRELVEIKRILSKQDSGSGGLTISRRATTEDAANDSGYKPNSLGLRLKLNGKNARIDSQGNVVLNVRSEDPVISDVVSKRLPPSKRDDKPRRKSPGEIKAGREKEDSQTDNQDITSADARRDSKGRFVSDKTNQAAKDKMERERERKRNIKDQEGFWGRFGESLRDTLEDKADGGDVTDIAGKAAGGVFWSAGKEFYDVAANASKSIYQFSKKFEADAANEDEVRQPKPVTRQPDDLIGSAAQLQEKREADDARDEKKSRDDTLKENERQTEILEELLDQSNKDAKGGSLLGGLASSLGDFFTGGKGKKGGARGGKAQGRAAGKAGGRFGKLGRMFKFGAAATVVGAGGAAVYDATTEKKPPKQPSQPVAKEAAAATDAAKKAEQKAASSSVTKAAEKSILSTATKGIGSAAKGALSAIASIPGLGAAISGGLGYIDEEGQNRAFGEGNVGTQQKSSYAATNILDFGGLTSLGFNAIADGAQWAGLSEEITSNLRIDPDVAAKQLDGIVTTVGDSVKSGFTSVMDFFSGNESQKAQEQNTKAEKKDDAVTEEVSNAVKDGTSETVSAIKDLPRQLTKEGGVYGQDGIAVPQGGALPGAVTQNLIGDDLNIGGSNSANRSFRNNNFGNLAFVGQAGATMEAPTAGGEQRFAKFETPEEGFRALANQLSLYGDGKSKAAGNKKLDTVEDIINLYAPDNENDTKGYIKNLSSSLGVGKNDKLDLSNPELVTKMIRGIATIEGGNPQVTDEYIKKAIGQKDANGKWRGEFSEESLKVVNAKRAEQGLSAVSKNDQFSNPEKVSNKSSIAVAPAASQAISPAKDVASNPDKDGNGLLNALPGGAGAAALIGQEQISKIEGIREPGSIKANEKANEKKQEANSTTATEQSAPADKTSWMAWASSLADGAALFGEDQIAQIEGLRDVKDTSGVAISSVMKKGGSYTGGQTVGAYDYGEPLGADGKPVPKNDTVKNISEADSSGWRTDANGVKFKYTDEKKEDSEPSFLSKVADTVIPSFADAFQTTIGGLDVGSMAGEALEGAGIDRATQGRFSPITNKLYGYGDKAAQDVAKAGGDTIRSIQPVQESRRNLSSVTDLAASGVRTESERNRDSNTLLVEEFKKMNATMSKLLTETKGNNQAQSSVITKTPQPQPKQNDIPLQEFAGALSQFLGE